MQLSGGGAFQAEAKQRVQRPWGQERGRQWNIRDIRAHFWGLPHLIKDIDFYPGEIKSQQRVWADKSELIHEIMPGVKCKKATSFQAALSLIPYLYVSPTFSTDDIKSVYCDNRLTGQSEIASVQDVFSWFATSLWASDASEGRSGSHFCRAALAAVVRLDISREKQN